MSRSRYLSGTQDNLYAVYTAPKILWINVIKQRFISRFGTRSAHLWATAISLVAMACFVVACGSNSTTGTDDNGLSGASGWVANTAGTSGGTAGGLGGTTMAAGGSSGSTSQTKATGGQGARSGSGGAKAGAGGGTAGTGASGTTAGIGASGTTAGTGAGGTITTPGSWPAADPGKTGPYKTVTENNVGPDNAYTMFRPAELTQRHPVITWGNGTGTTPTSYRSLLTLYASHGFIVIASNSTNVAQGNPPPMLNGVTWVLEQDTTQGSALYQRVDRDHIGATGHSQGAMAASTAGSDTRIKTIAPIETLVARSGLHGPALGLCGSQDTTVPCSLNKSSFDAISDQPVMYAEQKAADHINWMMPSAAGGALNPYYVITTAWFRVHLMNDTALRSMFYGECTVCKDTATWVTDRKKMDQ
jgi:hypothetical protein